MVRTKEGFIRVWRICNNPRCNDWNDEAEKIVVPYAIIKETKKAYTVVRMGWGYGKKQQHSMPKDQFYFSSDEAQTKILEESK